MAVAPLSVPVAPRTSVLPVAVAGLGAYLPAQVITNEDWSRTLDTSDEWIRSRTGIGERRHAAPDEATSDLAAAAARHALDDAGLSVAEIGAIVVATTTPDHAIPGTAPLVAALLGTEVPAFDLNAACSGFVYALRTGGALAATGAGPVLVIGAETLSRVTDPADRSTAVLFGDGAGAVVLVSAEDAVLGPFDAGADGTLADALISPASGTRTPVSADTVAAGAHYLTMRGGDVYRNAVQRMTASSHTVLEQAGIGIDDVDLLVGHQANVRILDAVALRLGMPAERTHVTVDRHGNTSAASIPLALADARESGVLRPGMRVLLTAFGAGFTWASCLLTWNRAGGVA